MTRFSVLIVRKEVRWLVFLGVVVAGVAVVWVARTVGPFGNRTRISPISPTVRTASPGSGVGTSPVGGFSDRPHVVPGQPDPVDEAFQADQAKPRYKGPLGDFLVEPLRNAESPPCPQPMRPINRDRDLETSELWRPGLVPINLGYLGGPEGPALKCADGTILGLVLTEYTGRRYFVGPAVVSYQAPRDRLVLMTIAGHPAIAELSIPGWPDSFELTVVPKVPE